MARIFSIFNLASKTRPARTSKSTNHLSRGGGPLGPRHPGASTKVTKAHESPQKALKNEGAKPQKSVITLLTYKYIASNTWLAPEFLTFSCHDERGSTHFWQNFNTTHVVHRHFLGQNVTVSMPCCLWEFYRVYGLSIPTWARGTKSNQYISHCRFFGKYRSAWFCQ